MFNSVSSTGGRDSPLAEKAKPATAEISRGLRLTVFSAVTIVVPSEPPSAATK